MVQMPRNNDNSTIDSMARTNLDQFIVDMKRVAQNSLIDSKIAKQIRNILPRIQIVSPEEYERLVRAATIEEASGTESGEQQIMGYINNSQSSTFTHLDEPIIAVKREYLGSVVGTQLGFDLLAEEVGHSIRTREVLGTLQDVPDTLWLFTTLGTTKEFIFNGVLNIIKEQNVSTAVPSSYEDIVIVADGFKYIIQSREGKKYFILSSGMYMEEMRASILETIFLSLHLGNPGGNLHVPAMYSLLEGANQIAARYNIGADYSREMTSLNFIYRYLSTATSESERSQMLRTLITKLCTLTLDSFMSWLETVNKGLVDEITHVLYEMVNYKKDLMDDMFKDSEL